MLQKQVTVNNKTYQIVKLLGKGKGGYSYLATCNGDNVVIKKIHHEPCSYYQFGDKLQSELNDYNKLIKVGVSMPQMLDVDTNQEIIVKQYVDGPTAFDLVKENHLPNWCIPQMESLAIKLQSVGLNIDYFPTNFIVQNNQLWYVDYECNNYMDEWNFENWGQKYWSQTPEFCQYLQNHTEN